MNGICVGTVRCEHSRELILASDGCFDLISSPQFRHRSFGRGIVVVEESPEFLQAQQIFGRQQDCRWVGQRVCRRRAIVVEFDLVISASNKEYVLFQAQRLLQDALSCMYNLLLHRVLHLIPRLGLETFLHIFLISMKSCLYTQARATRRDFAMAWHLGTPSCRAAQGRTSRWCTQSLNLPKELG